MSKQAAPIDISQSSSCCSLFTADMDLNIVAELYDFYQYRVANSADSPLSLNLDSELSDAQKDELYLRLLKSANICENDLLFSPILRNQIEVIRTMELSDSTLKCDRVKGFFHQKNSKNSNPPQHKIDSLFKHIRNAFAHGRIAFFDSFLVLEDQKNELTCRLVVTLNVLLKWKNTVKDYLSETVITEKGVTNNGHF